MNIIITGGAGFIGSNLCHRLLKDGHNVLCMDNFYTGREKNIRDLYDSPNFTFVNCDICDLDDNIVSDLFSSWGKPDRIYNLACPASPPAYQADPIHTTMTCTLGVYNVLYMAQESGARLLQASTSEVYGDPDIHPQPESYRGNVSCTGIRSCYDEGKRCAESLCFDFQRLNKAEVRVVRIFNTYGPYMRADDGRVLTNMLTQALKNEPITIYGDGNQTRSFCFVDDTIAGLMTVMESDYKKPVNIGNPQEYTIKEVAEMIKSSIDTNSEIIYKSLPQDDPKQRKPDITVAKSLGWEPEVAFGYGLAELAHYLIKEIL